MYIELDTSAVPPALALRESEDFKMFKIVVRDADHVWVELDQIKSLAGEQGNDPGWLQQFEGMVAYAREHGYIDDRGRMRGHVERAEAS
ncbi:MAG TPA: hypothetical protein VH834_02470 [Solirubrobacteraceae bacterium]|jgi:hypothetical protein